MNLNAACAAISNPTFNKLKGNYKKEISQCRLRSY
jgi:hypothetical protein